MSIDAREKSAYESSPVEGYWFTCGSLSFRYAMGASDLVILGFNYAHEIIKRTEVDQNQEIAAGSIRITLPLNNPVALLFKNKLPVQPVSVVIYGGQDGDNEIGVIFIGTVSSAIRETECELTVVTEKEGLRQSVPTLMYQIQCPRTLFSPGCALHAVDWEVLAALTYVSGAVIKSSAFATKPDGWFNGGWLNFGDASMSIVSHTGDTITLFFALESLVPGCIVQAFPGCDGEETTCRNKFNNVPNHLGFSRIPSTNPFGEGGIT